MRAFAVVVLLLAAASFVPAAVADHPGSNMGLARFVGLGDPLGLDRTVHRVVDVDMAFASWEAAMPDFVERYTIGTTNAGNPLHAVRVTDERVTEDAVPLSTGAKLRVFLDGGHHGNEFLGVELVMYYLEELLSKAAAGDAAALQFLAETEIYAVPIVNADGNLADTRKNARLVDPNRNYDFHWGEDGASDSPLDFTYHGPAPFSEPETRANADWQLELRPDMVITMHTGIAEFYWPWGWTHDPSPDDAFFTSLEGPFENATNGRVDAMQGAELYIVSGASDDWAYGVLGIPGFTYEVHEDQFIPVYGEEISALIADQLAGLDFMVKNVKRMGAWVEPTPVEGGWQLTNEGWGAAPNLTVAIDGVSQSLPGLGVGESVFVAGSGNIELTYPMLFLETSKWRTHGASAVGASAVPEDALAVPGAGAAVTLGGLLAALVVGLRRRS